MEESASTISRHNLPSESTPFIGREHELKRLAYLIADQHIHLITIVGMGGMGKTRLAYEAARRELSNFEDGVFVVPFVSVNNPLNIPIAIADAIGFHFTTIDNPLPQLQTYLSEKQILLVLDNFEHLIEAGAVISSILAAAPLSKVIVTSRQRLKLRSETLFRVEGMEVKVSSTLEQAYNTNVIQLFLTSARRNQPDFECIESNFNQVTTICQLVQGMPLGVELAAAWVNAVTLEEIATGIRRGVGFLETEFQDVPERHRNMRAVLEQSLQLLSDKEQRIFPQLCVFNGGFTFEAAAWVTATDLLTLTSLVNKSLIQRDLQGRYTIHELLRQLGQDFLKKDAAGYREIYTRHARFYCQFLIDLYNEINFGDTQAACRKIEPELSNIHLMWDWASQHEIFDAMTTAGSTLMLFREYQNRFVEFDNMYEVAIDHLRQFPPTLQRDAALAHMLMWQGWTHLRFGQLAQGLQAAEESWNLYIHNSHVPTHPIGNEPRVPIVILQALLGNLDAARQMGQEMLTFYSAGNNFSGVGMAYYALSVTELAAGDYHQVGQYAQQGYTAFQKVNHKYIQAYTLNNWGNAERALGNYDEAKRLLRESYNNMRDVGSIEGMAVALNHLAQIALLQSEYEEARSVFEKNIETYRKIGDRGGLAMTLEGLAQIALSQKHYKHAAHLLGEALEITGVSIGSVSLSILTSTGMLFLESKLYPLAEQILSIVLTHPAANQEVKQKALHLLQMYGLELRTDAPLALEQIISEVKRYLTTIDWQIHANAPDLTASLTEREIDILRLLAQGLSNTEIADKLVMTVGTIKWYLNQIYTKLHVKNRTEAVTQARRFNLLS